MTVQCPYEVIVFSFWSHSQTFRLGMRKKSVWVFCEGVEWVLVLI